MTGKLQRRDFMLGSAAAASAQFYGAALAQNVSSGETVVPWIDQPQPIPPPAQGVIRSLTRWEDLDSWITPNDKLFTVGHYDSPALDVATWRLRVSGLVVKPLNLSLADLKALPHQDATSVMECSGSNGLPFFTSAVGNVRWGGTPLATVLRAAQVKSDAVEVVFYGADKGEETLRKGTPMEMQFTANFARSMSVADAMQPANMLCYEMNGAALTGPHGFPLRLVCPGWYGIANVKWLTRIEVRATKFMGRFMGRDYVTVREEQRDGAMIVTETSVGRSLLKSAPARVTRRDGRHRIFGMAWGPRAITAVEVRIDNGAWTKAVLENTPNAEWAWRFWHLDWSASPGEHSVTSRAIDQAGNVQPAMDDASIAGKRTYWESNGQITRQIRIG